MTRVPPLSDLVVERLRRIVREHSGIVVPEIRRPELESAFRHLQRAEDVEDPVRLLDALEGLPNGTRLRADLVNSLTIPETYFYRDAGQFEAIETSILPEIFRRKATTRTVRIWSAGCSTGEEAYSLAIAVDRVLPKDGGWSVRIVATDINPKSLALAREGHYGAWSFRQTPPWLKPGYFDKVGDRFAIQPRVKDRITFHEWNLNETRPWPHSLQEFDLILCRNVLIYFDTETVRQLCRRFRDSLADGGWLVVAPAELTVLDRVPLDVVELPGSVVYRRPIPEPQVPKFPTLIRVPVAAPPAQPVSVAQSRPAQAPTREWVVAQLARPDRAAALDEILRRMQAPGSPTRMAYWVARGLADRGLWPEALDWAARAAAREPLAGDASYLLGIVRQELGQLDDALDSFRRCVFADPSHVLGHLAMADLLRDMGQPRRERASLDCVERWASGRDPSEVLPDTDGLTVGKILQRLATRRRA